MKSIHRTLLFVPATAERFLAKAHERGADALIVDLEDSIAPSAKADARLALEAVVPSLVARKVEVWIRVNAQPDLLVDDLAASAIPGVSGLMIPKVTQILDVAGADAELSRLENTRGLRAGSIRLCATLETPSGILAAPSVATGPRMAALAFGVEDLAAAMGVKPTSTFARGPAQSVAIAAAAAGIESWGLAGSLAEFSRPDAFERSVALSRAIGLSGILCIHPSQVEIANRLYRPKTTEVDWAREVVSAYDAAKAQGVGSIALGGRMIDEPIYQRARRILTAAG